MTIEQLHTEFKVFFDKVDSEAYTEFLDGEIDIMLNEAILRLVKRRYGINNIYKKGFEETQKRTDDLKELVVTRFADVVNSEQQNTFKKGYRVVWSIKRDCPGVGSPVSWGLRKKQFVHL